MGLQESFSKTKESVPFGYSEVKAIKKATRISSRVAKGSGRGFASSALSDRKKTQVRALGGKHAHRNPKGSRCHQFTSEEARHHALIRWGKLPKGTPFVQPAPKVR